VSKTFILLVLAISFFATPLMSKDVFVKLSTGQTGHGQLRTFNQKCFVVLPKHIIEDPAQIHLMAGKNGESDATVFYQDPDLDLAILKARSADVCAGARTSYNVAALDNLLDEATDAQLRVATEDGSELRIDLRLTEVNVRTIRFRSVQLGELVAGLSGSGVAYKNRTVGLMTSYDPSTKTGTAYREDVIEQFWQRRMYAPGLCDVNCEIAVSALTKAGAPCQQSTNPISSVVETVCDHVYQLPENWPTPPYFHVILDKIQLDDPSLGLHTDTGWKVFNFALSTSPAFKAQDVYIGAMAFESLSRVEGSFQIGDKLWSIEISGGTDPASMNIRINRAKNPFQ